MLAPGMADSTAAVAQLTPFALTTTWEGGGGCQELAMQMSDQRWDVIRHEAAWP